MVDFARSKKRPSHTSREVPQCCLFGEGCKSAFDADNKTNQSSMVIVFVTPSRQNPTPLLMDDVDLTRNPKPTHSNSKESFSSLRLIPDIVLVAIIACALLVRGVFEFMRKLLAASIQYPLRGHKGNFPPANSNSSSMRRMYYDESIDRM